jgi:uncharacterized protein
MTDVESGKGLIRAYLDAVGTLDVDAVAPLFHEDGKVVLPYAPQGFPPCIDGREAIDEYYRALPQMITPLNFDNYRIHALEVDGEFVAEYTSDCTIKNTGASYRNTYVTRVSVRDERIAVLAEFFDPIPLVESLGGEVRMPSSSG